MPGSPMVRGDRGVLPLRVPIRWWTAARLGLVRKWHGQPSMVIRIRQPVSDESLHELERRFAEHTRTRFGEVMVLGPDETTPDLPPPRPYRRPWWRRLLARSRW